MEKLLIATDFDGTLNLNGQVDGHTREAIDRWRAAGRYFGVVTGRRIDFYEKAKEIGIPFDYLIVCNGSLIVAEDRTVLYESLIPSGVILALERAMASYSDIVHYQKDDGTPQPHYYCLFPSNERALRVREELLPEFGSLVNIFVNGAYINIGNAGTGKAEGVAIILKHFGLPEDAAAVVGDDFNDLDMILAHKGWAVETGQPDVVRQAPHTCRTVGGLIDSMMAGGPST